MQDQGYAIISAEKIAVPNAWTVIFVLVGAQTEWAHETVFLYNSLAGT